MNSKMHHLEVNVNKYIGYRLDKFVAENLTNISRSKIKSLIEKGLITVNKFKKDPDYKLELNDKISINQKAGESSKLLGEDIKLNIIYEDEDILIINKPAGLVVHPGAGNKSGTLVNALIHYCGNSLSTIGDSSRPGIVHRIDKDTSGLLVIAKNDAAHLNLAKQFEEHTINRKYIALCWGKLKPTAGKLVSLISRSNKNRIKMMSSKIKGKEAITNYKTIETYFDKKGDTYASLVECKLETGRTHQIRVHLTEKGNSIIGDKVYGRTPMLKYRNLKPSIQELIKALPGQALHAYFLGFKHPSKNKVVEFQIVNPEYLSNLINSIKN
ncbi:RluA family pseudouridine synthase [Pelagibacteraceae bacterium]|nr:RluA family pseudouridine synthase [Pelagibacteraceae bacterium]